MSAMEQLKPIHKSLDDIAQDNLAKLFDRKERGVIQGNGDIR